MPLLNDGLTSSINSISSKIAQPFSSKVQRSVRDRDFNEFVIEELEGPKKKILLVPEVNFFDRR